MRKVFQQFDLGIDQLGQRGLVVHGRLERLERLESEHLRSSSEKREDNAAFIGESAQHNLRVEVVPAAHMKSKGNGRLDVPDHLPSASRAIRHRNRLRPSV
jgi:hypothetical protein